ncbi:MAG: hypothetical protein LBH98_07120 [Chitinispirillales bacterium]|nr:hypothetical protein [Chitinispirillales bacterium]
MKTTNLVLAILAALLFVSCCDDKKNDEQLNINAKRLIGTWRDSYIVDLDSIVIAENLPILPFLLGEATLNYEWTFNPDKKTGFVNAFLDYKGVKINAADHPRNFEYTAKETYITFPKFPYDVYEIIDGIGILLLFDINIAINPLFIFIAILSDDTVSADAFTTYIIEENKLTMHLFGDVEYVKVPK